MLSLQKNIFKRINKTNNISAKGLLFSMLFNPNYKVMFMIEKMRRNNNKYKKLLISYKIQKHYGCVISSLADIGENFLLPHPTSIVIGASVIGDNCTIFQQVTLGQKDEKFPKIGDNVTIYPGAKIFGNIKIGNNVIIGANSVVNRDVPDNVIVAGVPAKIIKVRG